MKYKAVISDIYRDGDGAWNVGLKKGWICFTSETHQVFELELDTVVNVFKSKAIVKCECEECK